MRRLMDVVEHMRSRKATDTMQFYGRRWIERFRAVKKLQARMRGSIVRKQERNGALMAALANDAGPLLSKRAVNIEPPIHQAEAEYAGTNRLAVRPIALADNMSCE